MRDREPEYVKADTMFEYLATLEAYEDPPAAVLQETGIIDILGKIARVRYLPKEGQYSFQSRCKNLQAEYQQIIARASGSSSKSQSLPIRTKPATPSPALTASRKRLRDMEDSDASGEPTRKR